MLWIRAGWAYVRVGGTVLNTLNGGGIEKRAGEAKILQKKGQAGSRDRSLKKGGLESP